MKKIPLSITRKCKYYNDKLFALVDDKNYKYLMKFK